MNIELFNKNYWVRRFGEQKIIKGYVTNPYEDFVVSLNVHPLGTDQQQALPEGERMIKRLEAHGTHRLITADTDSNRKGDLLYYHGRWYECVNAQEWDHTILSHINYQFVLVPEDGARSADIQELPNGGAEPFEPIPIDVGPGSRGLKIRVGGGLRIDEEGYLCIDPATEEEIDALIEKWNGGDTNESSGS